MKSLTWYKIKSLTQNSSHPTHCNVSNSTIFKSVAALLMHFSKLMWVRGSDVHLSGSRSKQNAHSCFIFIGTKRILIFLFLWMLIKVNVDVGDGLVLTKTFFLGSWSMVKPLKFFSILWKAKIECVEFIHRQYYPAIWSEISNTVLPIQDLEFVTLLGISL